MHFFIRVFVVSAFVISIHEGMNEISYLFLLIQRSQKL